MTSKEDMKGLTDVSLGMLAILESLDHICDDGAIRDAWSAYCALEERAEKLVGHPFYGDAKDASPLELAVSAFIIAREKFQDACRVLSGMKQSGTSTSNPEYLYALSCRHSRMAVLLGTTARFIEMTNKLREERKEGGAK